MSRAKKHRLTGVQGPGNGSPVEVMLPISAPHSSSVRVIYGQMLRLKKIGSLRERPLLLGANLPQGDLGQVPFVFGPLLPLKWVWKSGPDHRIASRSNEKFDVRCSEAGTKQTELCPCYEIPQWLPRPSALLALRLQLRPAHSAVARPLSCGPPTQLRPAHSAAARPLSCSPPTHGTLVRCLRGMAGDVGKWASQTHQEQTERA